MEKRIVKLDVREDIRGGREPFSRIMQTVMSLREGQKLQLIAPFEPVPLYAVLGNQGFSHKSRPLDGGDWEVIFARETAAEPQPPATAPVSGVEVRSSVSEFVEVDARGLEPPEPLVTILEAVAQLPDGKVMRAHTDRRPMHLYSQLIERGFAGESEEQKDGSFITIIRRG